MAVDNAQERAMDPLAEQAVGLLAKAMVTSHARDAMERQGLRLEAVARVVRDRLGG